MKKSYTVYFFIFLFIVIVQSIFAYNITDSDGNKIEFNKTFNRILSLYPAHTEVLIDIGAKDQLIGTSKGEYVYPEKVKLIPLYSYKDSIEKFIAAKPDLVIIRPMIRSRYADLVNALEKSGITVISLQPQNSSDLYNYWNSLGKLAGKEIEAKKYISDFKTNLNSLAKKADSIPISKRKTVFFEARFKRGLSTCSENAMSYFILKNIGVTNIFEKAKAKTGSSFISPVEKELLMLKGNSVDYYISQYGAMNRRKEKDIENTPGYQTIKAVQERNIFIIDEMKVSRPTHTLIYTMQYLAELIYPDYF